jgi:uncharacterized damage-inducible protein DinB
MVTELIRVFYGYNSWANKRILETVALLSPAQFLADVGASFPSIRDTLVHTMSSQRIWLARWQGAAPQAELNPQDFQSLHPICSSWEQLDQSTQVFLAELTRDALQSRICYTNTVGQPQAFPLWQLMLHQVNHATQHRSEVAVMLTHYKHSPGLMDLYYYLGQESK